MKVIQLSFGDRIQLKKVHPCGGDCFTILRVGSVMRIKCDTCGRDMNIDRIKLERSIKSFPEKHPEQKGSLAKS